MLPYLDPQFFLTRFNFEEWAERVLEILRSEGLHIWIEEDAPEISPIVNWENMKQRMRKCRTAGLIKSYCSPEVENEIIDMDDPKVIWTTLKGLQLSIEDEYENYQSVETIITYKDVYVNEAAGIRVSDVYITKRCKKGSKTKKLDVVDMESVGNASNLTLNEPLEGLVHQIDVIEVNDEREKCELNPNFNNYDFIIKTSEQDELGEKEKLEEVTEVKTSKREIKQINEFKVQVDISITTPEGETLSNIPELVEYCDKNNLKFDENFNMFSQTCDIQREFKLKGNVDEAFCVEVKIPKYAREAWSLNRKGRHKKTKRSNQKRKNDREAQRLLKMRKHEKDVKIEIKTKGRNSVLNFNFILHFLTLLFCVLTWKCKLLMIMCYVTNIFLINPGQAKSFQILTCEMRQGRRKKVIPERYAFCRLQQLKPVLKSSGLAKIFRVFLPKKDCEYAEDLCSIGDSSNNLNAFLLKTDRECIKECEYATIVKYAEISSCAKFSGATSSISECVYQKCRVKCHHGV